MFPTLLRDPQSGRGAEITKDYEQKVISTAYPALEPQKVRPFRQYLTDDGALSGSNDMGIDGSVTNQDFYIEASSDDDRYITSLSFIVGYGGSGAPFQFADGNALTNGVRLHYTSKRGDVDIHEAIKSNQDLFRLSFQNIPTAWELRGVNAVNDYGYFISADLTKLGLPFGVKLDRNTTQRLVITIRDDATNADSLNCIAYGFDRFE